MRRILPGLKRRARARAQLRSRVDELADRVERLERALRRHHEDTAAQLRRSDAVTEDLAAAIDLLRRRMEPPEDDRPS